MKQSKKLLSIFLAMLMLLGTVSVVGSAAKEEYNKSSINYDSIDNAVISAEQVADIVLDMVDDMLKDIDLSDINTYTKLLGVNLDFSSIDKAAETIYGLRDIIKNGKLGIKLGGDVEKLDVTAFNGLKRSKGDISVVVGVLKFLADNFGAGANIQKAAYGVGQDSKPNQFGVGGILWSGKLSIAGQKINLGFSVNEMLNDPDLLGMGWSVNNILADLQGFVKYLVFDMVMFGSYPYSSDGVNKEYSEVSSQFTDVTLDGMVDIILKNFLTTPQDYEYVPTGEVDAEGNPVSKKVWDESSYILSASKYAALGDLSLANNSLLDFVDKVLQIAWEDFGVPFLNNDLKKNFMRLMGADFITLDDVADKAEIDKAKADADYIDVAKASADKVALVKNYFCNAQMWNVDGTWYYRGFKTVEKVDAQGNPVTDAEGNVLTEDKDIFQRVDISGVDSLFNLIKWDYQLTGKTLDFNKMIPQYKSIIGCLNHLLYVLFDNAINVKALGINNISELWKDGDNSNFNENLMTTAKFLLKNFTFMFFGRNEAYVDLNTFKATPEFVKKIDEFSNDAKGREGLIAYILLPMLGDVLPQLVYDPAMFTEGLQIEQTAALLVREFLSDLTPQINYDAEIFDDASLATGRKFKTHTSAEWMDIILNMGLDLAMTYLDNITNINVTGDGLKNLHNIAKSKGVPSWKVVLEEIVDWAVLYIGNGDNGALSGLSPNALGAVRCITDGTNATAANYAGNAFNILSTALNALLPLGLLCNVSSANFALDVEMVFKRLIDVIDDLDLEVLLATFGRNGRTDNILTTDNVLAQVLGLVNKLLGSIWGRDLITNTTSLAGFVSNENISNLLLNLIDGLYERGDQLLRSLLPTVAQFVPEWGGEQVFRAPSVGLDSTYNLSSGSLGETAFDITNGSKRVWRGYMKDGARVQDEQYSVTVTDIKAYNYDGTASPYVSITSKPSTIGYSQSGQAKFKASGVPASGAIVRFDVSYTVTNGIDNKTLPGTYTKSEYVWLSYGEDRFDNVQTSKQQTNYALTPVYANADDIGSISDVRTAQLYRKDASGKDNQPAKITVSGTATQSGITYNNVDTELGKGETEHHNSLVADRAAFEASGLKAGDTITWKVKITAYEDTSGEKEVKLVLYSGNELEQLRELVNAEADQMRLAADYDTSKAEWTAYTEAFQAAFMAARQDWNLANKACASRTDFVTLYKNLEKASVEVEKAKKTETTTGAMINTLKSTVESIKKDLNGKDYRTYALYRWNRFYDIYRDANNVFAVQNKVNLGLETKNFNESPLTANEATTLLAGNTYKSYIEALYVVKTEEEAEEAKREYDNLKRDLASYQMIDLANMNSLLPVMKSRLLPRDGGVVNTYLTKEIESAKQAVGTDASKYSEMSWAVYSKALQNAEAVVNSDSQDTIFTAKYQLQVARNNLVLANDEADYSELETLIKQAETALANRSSYKNEDVDFGKVLAALGYEVNGTEIFPGAAKDVVEIPYSKADQDELDDAADELKLALAKLEFKDFEGQKPSGVTSTNIATGEDEPANNVYTKKIDAKQNKEAVAQLLKMSDTKYTVQVSLDDKYTAVTDKNLADTIPVGTGATVTITTKVGDVDVPVATIKLIVEGDVTGDGVIDTLDCMIADIVKNGDSSLDGVYFLAGDVAANQKIDVNDVNAIVNKAVPDKIA